jgi:hypothetical protein
LRTLPAKIWDQEFERIEDAPAHVVPAQSGWTYSGTYSNGEEWTGRVIAWEFEEGDREGAFSTARVVSPYHGVERVRLDPDTSNHSLHFDGDRVETA